jgi:hypothetical protein
MVMEKEAVNYDLLREQIQSFLTVGLLVLLFFN